MSFRVRAFSEDGLPAPVDDPFLASLNEGGEASTSKRRPRPALPEPGPTPQDFLGQAQDELLRPFFEESGRRAGLEQGVEGLEDQIDRLSRPLNSAQGGRPRSTNAIYDALEADGLEGAEAVFEGLQNRRSRIGELSGQRDELAATLEALDADGSSPTQALRDFFRHTPNVNGRNFPAINPENESPEDVVALFSQAMEARLDEGVSSSTERYDSGIRGRVGENIDHYYTLLGQNKIELVPEGVKPNFDQFDSLEDYSNFFALDLRLHPPAEGFTKLSVAQRLLQADPSLRDRPRREFDLLVATLLDRVDGELDTGQPGALEEWLGILTVFNSGAS